MIDLHCHILPGLDDGARTLEESLSMTRRAVADGIQTIVATPHTLDGVHVNPVHKVSASVTRLREILAAHHMEIRLMQGADIHLCPRIMERIQKGDAGTINNTMKYILLELPVQIIPPGVKEEIFSLKMNGITPIITHPERHPAVHRDIRILYELVRMGALSQITAMSITGEFGEEVMHCAEMLLRHRLVHVIASDAHSPDSRPPVLSAAVDAAAEILGSYEEAEGLVSDIPEAIVRGDSLDIPEPRRLR